MIWDCVETWHVASLPPQTKSCTAKWNGRATLNKGRPSLFFFKHELPWIIHELPINLAIIYFLTHRDLSYLRPSGKDLLQQGQIRQSRPIRGSFSTSGRQGHCNPICNHEVFSTANLAKSKITSLRVGEIFRFDVVNIHFNVVNKESASRILWLCRVFSDFRSASNV